MAEAIAISLATEAAIALAKEVASSSRSVTITVKNETNFHLIGLKTHFECGTFFKPPASSVGPGEATVFSVKSKGGFYGVEGSISYQLCGGDVTVYFDNPFTGSNRHGVEFFPTRHASAKENYDGTSAVKADTPDNRYRAGFHVYSLAGGGNNSVQDVFVRK